jgi:hypothetical protein
MLRSRSMFCLALVVGFALHAGESAARTVQPGWDRRIPGASRFKVIYDDSGVLDQETGLVWHRRPGSSVTTWGQAIGTCMTSKVGNRKGWRLARADELQSLMDVSQSAPPLTPGHPFINLDTTNGVGYWTATDVAGNTGAAYAIGFFGEGQFLIPSKGSATMYHWCVRGPGGAQLD